MNSSKAILTLQNKAVELKAGLEAARTLLSMRYEGTTKASEVPVTILDGYLEFATPLITELKDRRIIELQKAACLDIPEQQQKKHDIEKAYCEEMGEVWNGVREFGVDVCALLEVPVAFERIWKEGEEELGVCRERMLELVQTGLVRSK